MNKLKQLQFVPGRGLILLAQLEFEDDLKPIGHKFEFDGQAFEVIGIERSMQLTNPPKHDKNVGYLVRRL